MAAQTPTDIETLARDMRLAALEMSFNCGHPAHIGGALSMMDMMAVLYGHVMEDVGNKDRFILSKGHAVLGLLAALYRTGVMTKEDTETFQTDGSKFIAHPIMNIEKGIESSNGSLGQGLSMGIGIAISYQRLKKPGNVFIMMGDGECYEGAVWEAAICAVEQNLGNLTAIIDCNGHQNDGAVPDDMLFDGMYEKWRGFGWDTVKCDGHDVPALMALLKPKGGDRPVAIIAKTTKGKGVAYMEDNNDWHHNRMSQKLYDEAVDSVMRA